MRVLITGANRGLGLEFAKQLAARGDRIFATCRVPADATALHELSNRYGDQISVTALDVSDPESIAQSFADISAQTHALDLLINNAAVALNDGELGSLDLGIMQKMLFINSITPMLVTQQYLTLIKAGNKSKIINMSSGAGSIGRRDSLAPYSYGASKAALNFYSRNLSHEVKSDGVTVIALSPGWVKTDMGGPDANLTPEESINGMLSLIDRLTLEDSGRFYDYTGTHLPW